MVGVVTHFNDEFLGTGSKGFVNAPHSILQEEYAMVCKMWQ